MTIRAKTEPVERIIDLTGPDGNAFVLMGYAQNFAKQLGMISGEIEMMLNEMRSGDYENLIQVFDRYFGSFVVLER